jgi:hypothetical protein
MMGSFMQSFEPQLAYDHIENLTPVKQDSELNDDLNHVIYCIYN